MKAHLFECTVQVGSELAGLFLWYEKAPSIPKRGHSEIPIKICAKLEIDIPRIMIFPLNSLHDLRMCSWKLKGKQWKYCTWVAASKTFRSSQPSRTSTSGPSTLGSPHISLYLAAVQVGTVLNTDFEEGYNTVIELVTSRKEKMLAKNSFSVTKRRRWTIRNLQEI